MAVLENTIGLLYPTTACINVAFANVPTGSVKERNFDFDTAAKKFIQNICIGLNCPAFVNNTDKLETVNCSGPKTNVEIRSGGGGTTTMSADAELTTLKPINQSLVRSLKCDLELIGIV